MSKNHESEIRYWFQEENILTVPCISPPTVGEIIHIDTEMNEHWYDARWKDRKFFHDGVCEYFRVKTVNRYYTSIDIELTPKEMFPDIPGSSDKIIFPSQKIIEVFETQLEKCNKDGEVKND